MKDKIEMHGFRNEMFVYSARVIALAWAGFWMFFGIASGSGENLRLTGVLMHVLLPGLVFLGIALLAWRWAVHGAFLFIAIGILILVGYPIAMSRFPFSTVVFVWLTMALPPIIAGVLLHHASRNTPFTAEN